MKKRVSVLLLLSCFFMTACGRSEDIDTESTKVPNTISTSKVTEAPIEKGETSVTEAPTSAPTEIPPESINPLYRFSYRWEDMTVQFPGWFSEYFALGADYADYIEDGEEVVAPGEQRRNEADQMILYNCTSEPLPARMCAVAGVVLQDYYGYGGDYLPGNIEVGIATGESVLATYGEPTYEQDGVLTYELERNRYVKLVLKDNILVEAEICNMIPLPENTRYFGYALEDLKASKFRLNAVEFQLPCRYSDLKDAGWEFKGDSSVMVEPWELEEEMWTKEGFNIIVAAYNNTDTSISIMDCTVFAVMANELDSVPMFGGYSGELILPGGIKLLKSTKNDLLVAYGEPTNVYEYSSEETLFYEFGEDIYVRFEVDHYTEKLIAVEYVHFPEAEAFRKNK